MISEISGKVLLLAVLLFSMQAGGAPNPVLPRAADSGVLYFNGHYYLMGFCTDGAFYKSQNLVDWNGPHHAFSMNNEWATGEAGKDTEIHACDIAIHNGQFNLYWSVNYGELRAVGRAVSDTILGPYYEPEQKHPFDGRIDPHLFRDTDGRCYFYTVKFTEGNVIYGQAMSGPDALIGEAKSLLSAVPHTWEFMDHKVNEGPCVIRYRDRCFMLYNGNHTGLSYGNYGIGCAASDAPLTFNNDTKYPFPLLRTNWDRIYENSRALSPISRKEGVLWKFTDTTPADTWAAPMYDDSEWTVKEGSFGNQKIFMLGGTLRSTWNSSEIWTRRKFMVEEKIIAEDLYVFINHDADAEVFLNGVLACCVSGFSGGYKLKSVTAKATETLHQGENVLAVHCTHDDVGAQYIDAGLYLFPPNHAEIAIENCGQPNLVRGPNGFEWWLVYFAVYDGNPMRSQGIDRVHFFDKELVMMPPTSPNTPGEWQLPSAPTFSDTFDETDMAQVWTVDSGSWNIKQGTLTQDENASIREIHLNLPTQRHYLFETGLLFSKNTTGQAGIKVGQQGVYIGLDRA
ncbi:MAG: family 43 glycosylhydrolase, partial [Candidatus Hydrogenedentes bacterium]|nr:family 43 glycosylhydrolase [Candidatus Hydrogenedentota bacterium]